MLDSTMLQEIENAASKMFAEWSRKWFWRRRLPGFLQLRRTIIAHIRSLMCDGFGKKHYFGVTTLASFGKRLKSREKDDTVEKVSSNKELAIKRQITFDELVLQVIAINTNGQKFDFKVAYHKSESWWTADSGKRDNWETFKDCHTEVAYLPAWYEIQLVVSPNL